MINLAKVDHAVIVPAGRYWLGDPIIVFGETEHMTPIAYLNGHESVLFKTTPGKYGMQHTAVPFEVGKELALIPWNMLSAHHINAHVIEYGHMLMFISPTVCWQKDNEMDFGGLHLNLLVASTAKE